MFFKNKNRIPKNKFVDSIIMPEEKESMFKDVSMKQLGRAVLVSKVALVLILGSFVLPLSAFEAHVVNVTAVIENRVSCDALSIGYWRNHEGCDQGNGYSDWTTEVSVLSAGEFSGVFGTYSGQQICENLWIPNCPSGNGVDSKLCKAKAMALGDELNIVSGRLDLDALIAGADDGDQAFDDLGLSYGSTVRVALEVIEMVLSNPNSSTGDLTSAAYVAERIYAFYEDENPIYPACIFEGYGQGGVGEPFTSGITVSIEPPDGVTTAINGNVVLNEILHNPEGFDDGNGLKGEWVELYNNEDFPVDVNNWYIEPFSAPGNSQVISLANTMEGGTIIDGKGWMVVFMDGEVLNNFGETISLYNLAGELKDEVHVGPAFGADLMGSTPGTENTFVELSATSTATSTPVSEDPESPLDLEGKSTARIPDGTGEWIDPIPTPGGPNKLEKPNNAVIEPVTGGSGVNNVTASVVDVITKIVKKNKNTTSSEAITELSEGSNDASVASEPEGGLFAKAMNNLIGGGGAGESNETLPASDEPGSATSTSLDVEIKEEEVLIQEPAAETPPSSSLNSEESEILSEEPGAGVVTETPEGGVEPDLTEQDSTSTGEPSSTETPADADAPEDEAAGDGNLAE